MTSLRNSIVALAVSLPLVATAQPAPAAPAAAAAPAKPPLVAIYGTVNMNLQYTEASGATAAGANVSPRAAISFDSTNLGVRGGAEFAPGYQVVYQCETQASVDGEDLRALCNRNSRIGVGGFWGTLFYGNWDTPYKALHYGTKADDPFGNTDVFGFQGLGGSPGYRVRSTVFQSGTGGISVGGTASAVTVAGAGFDVRAGNSVAYWSPKFAGVSAKVQYSVNENRSASGTVDPQLLAASVNFDAGGLSVGVAAEYHEDMYGIRTPAQFVASGNNIGNSAAKDLGLKAVAGYELPIPMGTLRVMGMIERLSYEQKGATVGFKDYSRLAWLTGASFRTGNHEFRARYGQALDPDITAATGTTLAAGAEDDLAAQHYAVGYAYHASKSTQFFAFYTQILNDDRARYTFGVSGAAAVLATPDGSDPLAGGLGIRFAF